MLVFKYFLKVFKYLTIAYNNHPVNKYALLSLLPARRRPQGLVVIGVCLSVCLCVCAHSFVRKISEERVHGLPPNLVGESRG